MRIRSFAIILLSSLIFWSCQDDDDRPTLPQFSIAGNVMDNHATYGQTVFDGGSNGNINVFNRLDNTTYLQVFKNGKDDSKGFWTIRLREVDIENITVPYTLTGVEASITWVDETVKKLQKPCSAADVFCFYSGVGFDEVKITITDIENNTISGEFEGILYHIRVNPSVIRDTNDYVEVANGRFSMKFQTKP